MIWLILVKIYMSIVVKYSAIKKLRRETLKRVTLLSQFFMVLCMGLMLSLFLGAKEVKKVETKKLRDYKIMPIFHRYPVSDPQISPDGTRVLFTYTTINIAEDRYDTHIWSLALDEKTPKQFTYGNGNDSHPRWSSDGKTILFISNRLDRGENQLFVMPADGGEARSLTDL